MNPIDVLHCAGSPVLTTKESARLMPIRSFVHRQGRLSPRKKNILTTLLEHYRLPTDQGPLNLEKIFQRTAPTTLEIGFGMGQHLLTQAQQHPEQNFLGIEVHRPGIAAVLLGIERLQLSNLKMMYADVADVLDHCIEDSCLDRVQIFFPDPWPKRKHHKRRLIQAEFAKQLQRKLKTGGQLQLATDWQDYAQQALTIFEQTSGLKNSAGSNNYSPRIAQRAPTKFEQRGQQLGRTIWDLVFYSTT